MEEDKETKGIETWRRSKSKATNLEKKAARKEKEAEAAPKGPAEAPPAAPSDKPTDRGHSLPPPRRRAPCI